MRLNHAQRRALRLLDRGQTEAFISLPAYVLVRLVRAGLVDPSTPEIITPAGREAANVSFRNGDANEIDEP